MTTSHAVIHFPYSSIEFIADANQCQHLSDECIKYLTLESTNIVRTFLHDALKFTRKCRRTKMLTEDFESAMKLRQLDVNHRENHPKKTMLFFFS
jgi:hypothetical protein